MCGRTCYLLPSGTGAPTAAEAKAVKAEEKKKEKATGHPQVINLSLLHIASLINLNQITDAWRLNKVVKTL